MTNVNRIDVPAMLSGDMKKVYEHQLAHLAEDLGPDYPSLRRAYVNERRFWNEGGPVMKETLDLEVPTPYGSVRARLHKPGGLRPGVLVYIHGGGYLLGGLDTHDRIMRMLAELSGLAVLGVDYTLSPEAKFPQAIEECAGACAWLHEHQDEFGLDMSKVAFAGDSAGAHIAMATALWIRDKGVRCGTVAGLLLYYGLYGLSDSPSRRLFGGPWDGLAPEDLALYEDLYLPEGAAREEAAGSPYYCIFNGDLTHDVPPLFIVSAQYDPLRDDSAALHEVVSAHGGVSVYECVPGVMHAFLHHSRMLPETVDVMRKGAAFLKAHMD